MANTKTLWRQMNQKDVPTVKALADAVHKAYPEDEAVFAERLFLYPAGCFVFMIDQTLSGYAIAHPWRLQYHPPALNSLLHKIPAEPDTLYIHDLALAISARGKNATPPIISKFVALAKSGLLNSLSLTAVGGSAGFWQKNGFSIQGAIDKQHILKSYGRDAEFMTYQLS